MDHDEEPTCGKGLAEHSRLPATLAELERALAHVLETHMTALDTSDSASREERTAYAALSADHGNIADRLDALARRMAGYRNLPMGKHFMEVMMSLPPLEAFRRFVAAEEAVTSVLQASLERDRAMLSAMESGPTRG
jgi:hypothetical protein